MELIRIFNNSIKFLTYFKNLELNKNLVNRKFYWFTWENLIPLIYSHFSCEKNCLIFGCCSLASLDFPEGDRLDISHFISEYYLEINKNSGFFHFAFWFCKSYVAPDTFTNIPEAAPKTTQNKVQSFFT